MKQIEDHQTSRRKIGVGTIAGWIMVILLGTAGCKKEAPAPLPPPVVQVAEVTATNAPLSVEFIGQLDSPQNVEVRARVEAFVEKILFTEGTEVKERAPLFLLDKKPFEERLAAAQGMLAEAKAQLGKYNKDVARLQPLAEKRAIPQQDLDNALVSVDVGKASVLSAQARVQSMQLDLGYCDVRAPLSGLIGRAEFIFGTAAEVMQMMSNLPSKAQVIRPGASEETAPASPETDDMAAAIQAGKGQPPSAR
jgi:membrane fusion protein (multidrug efflux system)